MCAGDDAGRRFRAVRPMAGRSRGSTVAKAYRAPAGSRSVAAQRRTHGLLDPTRRPQQRAAQAKQAAQAAVTEDREQLRQRIDQAKVDVDQAATDARQDASAAAASAKTKWAQMKADAAAKMDDLQARIDKRADQIDANVAADDAAWAEDDAAAAIDYASWTVDNARLAVPTPSTPGCTPTSWRRERRLPARPFRPRSGGATDRRAAALDAINPGPAVQHPQKRASLQEQADRYRRRYRCGRIVSVITAVPCSARMPDPGSRCLRHQLAPVCRRPGRRRSWSGCYRPGLAGWGAGAACLPPLP